MKTHIALAALIAAFLPSMNLRAADLPHGGVTSGIGVNIHFTTGHGRDLDMIAAAGFKFVRMDFFWARTEREKGRYDWSAYDGLTEDLARRRLRPYYILDYSNPLYEKGSPRHPDSVAAFARWAAAAAQHFRGRRVIWEIWNEPNGRTFWFPKPDADQYTTLALAAARAVRAADPNATIFGPASASFPWPFLETFLKSGVLEYLDGVSVHPYRSPHIPPETAAIDYVKLRKRIDANTPASRARPIPIVSGEWGYSSFAHGVTLDTQAAFLARQQLANAMDGVAISIWYDWKNDGNDSRENEQNFGTVRYDLTPKPAYVAITTLTHELAGYNIDCRLPEPTNDYVLVLTNAAGRTKLAAWTLGQPHSLELALIHAPEKLAGITVKTSDGRYYRTEADGGSMTLSLTGAPRYADLGVARPK